MSTQTEAVAGATGTIEEMAYRDAVNAALHDEMAADPDVVFFGEDVANDGGVFKTNYGLPEAFGPERVFNTPICENGFVGVALGMSLMGLRPVVEFMFSDFLPTAGDAIVNQLPKYRFMSGGQCAVPVTLRSVSGATGRFGTQHSATGESWFMSHPGLRVATASSPASAYSLLRAAIRDNNPTIVHEHKGLFGTKGEVRRGEVAEVGKAAVERVGTDVTIVSTLLMQHRARQAGELLAEDGIDAELIDLRWIRPLDVDTVRASVRKTGRLVVVEEQVHNGGWGASLISSLAMEGAPWTAPPRAVSLPNDLLMPYSPPLEDEILPTPQRIAEATKATVAEPA
ncbi:MAG: transketolase C-terminal domain-containing protein [Acidimicrobiia bacterium]